MYLRNNLWSDWRIFVKRGINIIPLDIILSWALYGLLRTGNTKKPDVNVWRGNDNSNTNVGS